MVTGGATGIGRATALALAAEGAAVVVGDRDAEGGQRVAAEIAALGGQAAFERADVGVSADVAHLIAAAVERWGGLDVLVNNAGVMIPGTAVDISEADWNLILNVNLGGAWRGMKYAIPHMIQRGGGSIISVSSTQALQGLRNWSAYAASKGGINSLTQQAAVEYAPHGIRINAVAPGTIMTQMNEQCCASRPIGIVSWLRSMPPTRWAVAAAPKKWPPSSSSWPPTKPRSSPARCMWWMAAGWCKGIEAGPYSRVVPA